MTVFENPDRAWTFTVGLTRIWCVGDDALALYDADVDTAWIASECPVSLREWR